MFLTKTQVSLSQKTANFVRNALRSRKIFYLIKPCYFIWTRQSCFLACQMHSAPTMVSREAWKVE